MNITGLLKKRFLVLSGMFFTLMVILMVISSCEAVFTYSPVSFLQRDPANMPTAQKITYAEDALASGETAAMQKAFNNIKELAKNSPDDPDINMLAAKLAVELSGVPDVVDQIVQGDIDLSSDNAEEEIAEFLEKVNPELMVEAGQYYQNADSNGGDLSSTDYIMGAMGILLDAADDVSGKEGDYSSVSNPDEWASNSSAQEKVEDAVEFLNEGLENMDDNDPAKDILEQFSSFIGDYAS